ncbi:MAG TPA: hypothetical protein VMF69_25010 [Gemmataceae bacterium]|nr:hypothetical protein [Gemmataceae bacterium]
MNATYSETTKQGNAELPLLQQATACLEEILRSSAFADQVRAEWDGSQDPKGRTFYTLRLSAWEESVSASFTPRDLRDPREMRWQLRDLWDNMLRIRFNKSLENLTKGSDGA